MLKPLSRGCRQRVSRRRAVVKCVNESIGALNWCAGFSKDSRSVSRDVCFVDGVILGSPLTPLHGEVLNDVLGRVVQRGPPPENSPSQEEAARALLRARFGYEPGAPNVAAYSPGHVSLPASLVGAPAIKDVVPTRVRDMLEKVDVFMLRDKTEFLQLRDHGGVEPYMDRALERSPALSRKFITVATTRVPASDAHAKGSSYHFLREEEGRSVEVGDRRSVTQPTLPTSTRCTHDDGRGAGTHRGSGRRRL